MAHCVIHAQPSYLPPLPPPSHGAERRKYPINRESNSPDTPRNPINFPSPALFPAISTVFTTAARSRTAFPPINLARSIVRQSSFRPLDPGKFQHPKFARISFSRVITRRAFLAISARKSRTLPPFSFFFFPNRRRVSRFSRTFLPIEITQSEFFKIPFETLRREYLFIFFISFFFFSGLASGMLCPHFPPPPPSRARFREFPLNSSTAKRFSVRLLFCFFDDSRIDLNRPNNSSHVG